MQLRWYQSEAVDAIFDRFSKRSDGATIVALPTAAGKSVVIADTVRRAFDGYPGMRVLMVTDVKELVAQNFTKLKTLWPFAPAGVFSAGLKRRETQWPITFCSIGSVYKLAPVFGHIDLVLIDECHMISDNDESMYRVFLHELRRINPNLAVVGMTATPYRLGLGHLTNGTLFTDVCYDATDAKSFRRLLDEGFLAPLTTKRPGTFIDTSKIGHRGGEFIESQANAAVDKAEIIDSAVREIMWHGQDRSTWLVFGQGIEHVHHIVDCFNFYGVPAVAIHSKLSREDRDRAFADYERGVYRVAVNNGVMTKGYDNPRIDLIGVLRLTESSALHVQMLGRGMRVHPEKRDCLVLDFAGNTRRCGQVDRPVIPRKRGEAGGDSPVRVCAQCGTYQHASARFCEVCGIEFPRENKLLNTAATDAVMACAEEPVLEWFDVSHVEYSIVHRKSQPAMVKATYYCGFHKFDKVLCFDHEPGHPARHFARKWWRERSGTDAAPDSVYEALQRTGELMSPAKIQVHVNKRPYKDIVTYA